MSSALAAGRGHHLYGESAWPSDILFVFPPAALAPAAAPAGLAAACPPGADLAPAGPFLTPAEILPEYYLRAAFNLVRAVGSKAGGAPTAPAAPARLALSPLAAESAQHFLQSPPRRPAAAGGAPALAAGDLPLAAGAQAEVEPAAPGR